MLRLLPFFLALFLFLGPSVHALFTKLSGEYFITIESIEVLTDIPQDGVEWNTSLRKVSRYKEAIVGSMHIKKRMGPIGATLAAEIWGQGGYKKFLMDESNTDNVCDDEIHRSFFEMFNGTFHDDKCILLPCKTFLRPVVVDDVMHKHQDKILYGKFRLTLGYTSQGKVIMGSRFVFNVRDIAKKGKRS